MESKKQQSEKGEKSNVYHCPMKCEGSKTYDHEGNCPVCNMKLKSVDSKTI
jgi:Cu+-exporting ATPase